MKDKESVRGEIGEVEWVGGEPSAKTTNTPKVSDALELADEKWQVKAKEKSKKWGEVPRWPLSPKENASRE
eukprot:6966968-Karenia_brevis.AAC.1